MDEDLERPGCGLPTLGVVAIGVLVVVGLLTVVGWAFSLAWAVIRLVIVLVVLAGIATIVRAYLNRR